jgi:Na+/proline symporter
MIAALVLLPILAIADLGGLEAFRRQLDVPGPDFIDPFALTTGALIGFLGIGLGSPGSPHIVVRYMSIRDPAQLRYSAVVGTAWNVVMAAGAIAIGLVGRAYFPEVSALPGADTENLYPTLAQQHLPPFFFGIAIAAVFAAIMSTADSQLLVAASSVVRDVYERVLRRGEALSQRTLVLYSRAVVLALVLLALGLGVLANRLVFWLVLFAWAGLGAALGPTSILALTWRRTTRAGIFAGLLVGTVATVVWSYTPTLKSRMYELVPAFLLSLLATALVSRITRSPADVEEMFRSMSAGPAAPARAREDAAVDSAARE